MIFFLLLLPQGQKVIMLNIIINIADKETNNHYSTTDVLIWIFFFKDALRDIVRFAWTQFLKQEIECMG